MRIIDTHAHIYSIDYKNDIDEVIERAKQAGLTKILLPNIDKASVNRMYDLVDAYPSYCIPMMGLHPNYVKDDWEKDLEYIKEQFAKRDFIAVGEIGIDLFRSKKYQEQQTDAFRQQLEWSIAYKLPVAIHAREANMEVVEVIKSVGAENLRGVFHSFSGSLEEMQEILKLGNFMLGVNGIVTFKNSNLGELLPQVDLSRIIVETDAPYLAPMPYRGKRNEPSYTSYVVEKLAEIYKLSPKEIGNITTENAIRLFNLKA